MDNFFNAGAAPGGGGGGVAGPIIQWLRSLPPITRLWLASTLTITALANLEIISWTDLSLSHLSDVTGGKGTSNNSNISDRFLGRVEAWRLITCFMYIGKFSWHSVINLHLMTQISARYESMGPICTRRRVLRQQQQQRHNNSPYHSRGETSDYLFCLLFGMTGILLSQFYLLPYILSPLSYTFHHYRFFSRHLTFYVLYIWSKHYPHHNVNLFGVVMSAAYLPYAYLVMGYAMNNGEVIPMDMLHGMFIGHVYYYLACIVPSVLGRGRSVLSTPILLIDLCDWLEGRRLGFVGGDANGGEGEPIVVDTDGIIGG
jgi:Derlin-2/3